MRGFAGTFIIETEYLCTWRARREQGAAEALGSAYAVLRAEYLELCGAALRGAASWQAAEAALTALR